MVLAHLRPADLDARDRALAPSAAGGMTMAATTPFESLPIGARGTRATGWWGMALLVTTEATLFAYFLFSYFYLASVAPTWPPTRAPDLTIALPNTAILLASSGTMWWAERGITRGEQMRLRVGLLITLVLGATFLSLQGVEYHRQSITLQSGAYGGLFFTITGFHGAHVLVGLLMNVYVQLRAWLGHFTAERHLAVSNAAFYWHFVDVVWLAVFTSLYLSPRFGA
jgi:heme/copper-type cytochrome/quinol oxidase subunit 3